MFEEDESLKEQEAAARAAKKKKEEEEKKRKEEEKQRKLEEKKRREEERRNKPNWFKSTFDKLSNEIFSDEDMSSRPSSGSRWRLLCWNITMSSLPKP